MLCILHIGRAVIRLFFLAAVTSSFTSSVLHLERCYLLMYGIFHRINLACSLLLCECCCNRLSVATHRALVRIPELC